MRIAWMGAMALLCMVPWASAELLLHVDPPSPIDPSGATLATGYVSLDCPTVLAMRWPVTNQTIALNWSMPAGTRAFGPNDVRVTDTSCLQNPNEAASFPFEFTLMADKSAPGLLPRPSTVTATLKGAASPQDAKATQEVEITVAYVPHFLVSTYTRQLHAERGNDVTFDVTLRNSGNADAVFEFTLARPAPWPVTLPEPTLVPWQGENTVTVPLQVTVGGDAKRMDLDVRVVGTVVQDPSQTTGTGYLELTVLEGSCGDPKGCVAPAPAPFVGLIITALAAAWRRRNTVPAV